MKLRALAGESQHRLFRIVQGFASGRPIPRAVLQMLAQTKLIEARGNLVVLLIGRVGFDRYWTRLQLCDQPHQVRLLRFRVPSVLLTETLRKQAPNLSAYEPVGDEITFEQVQLQVFAIRLGS